MSNKGSVGNQGNEGSVWLRVQLSRGMHQRLKAMAVQNGGTLKGLVVQILADGVKCGAELVQVRPVAPEPKAAPEPVRVEPRKTQHSAYTA